MKTKTHLYPIIQAVLAAALFGASTPLAKLLLGRIEPLPMAALLYVGSGLGATAYVLLRKLMGKREEREASLEMNDVRWLAGAVLAGGVAAPVVLMFSLRLTPAATASLLLNFEGVATVLLAAILFKEAVGRRVLVAVAFITAAGILLSLEPESKWGISVGAIGVICACALWGIDNNVTRNISNKDPLKIVGVKGVCAGTVSLMLSVIAGQSLPSWGVALAAMALGSVSYGASIVLFILAMRSLGAARTSAYFGSAPFIGALLSFLLFGGSSDVLFIVSVPLLIIGAVLLVGEEHAHVHMHPDREHEHAHRHDDQHHDHTHEGNDASGRSHSHRHRHQSTSHSHPHAPDTHHRHNH